MYSWREFVRHVANVQAPYPHLKAAIVAQAALECGWGETKLFTEHGNPFGMHYHEFLRPLGAVGVEYEAHDGKATYCQFATPAIAWDCYWAWFQHWQHYGDWQAAAKKTALDWLMHIGPHYCPPGFTLEWKAMHNGLNYAEYIVRQLYPRAELELAAQIAKPADLVFRAKSDTARTVLLCLAQWAPSHIEEVGQPTEPVKPPPAKKGKRIYLDPGHSRSRPGADGTTNAVHEEIQNEIAADVMARDLRAAGHEVVLYNPDPDNLEDVGSHAAGFDSAWSLHHNAFDRKEHYVCVFGSKQPSAESKKLGGMICEAISKAINLKSEGVKPSGYTVPNLFSQVCKGPSGLIEFYFIDAYGDSEIVKDRTTRAAKAAAQAIIDYFK
jgi:N-acetylmuramoyl-L-alanine amidase